MSGNFSQLKNMWENRASEKSNTDSVGAPTKPAPGKLVVPTFKQDEKVREKSSQQKKPIVVETEMPRQSVNELKNNLEGKIKMGPPGGVPMMGMPMMGAPRPKTILPNNIHIKPDEEVHGEDRAQRKTEPVEKQEPEPEKRMPSFLQSKANLEAMFVKMASQPPPKKVNKQDSESFSSSEEKSEKSDKSDRSESTFIMLEGEEKKHMLSPEERVQQVMNRIFSPSIETQFKKTSSEQLVEGEKPEQEKETSLNLRGMKKSQKRTLEDFDDL